MPSSLKLLYRPPQVGVLSSFRRRWLRPQNLRACPVLDHGIQFQAEETGHPQREQVHVAGGEPRDQARR